MLFRSTDHNTPRTVTERGLNSTTKFVSMNREEREEEGEDGRTEWETYSEKEDCPSKKGKSAFN